MKDNTAPAAAIEACLSDLRAQSRLMFAQGRPLDYADMRDILHKHFPREAEAALPMIVRGRVAVLFEDDKDGGWMIRSAAGKYFFNREGYWVFPLELFMYDRWPTQAAAEAHVRAIAAKERT